MRKTSYCKLSTILCLVFLHIIFCNSASYAVGTDPTGERREETAPNSTDMLQNKRAKEIIAFLKEGREGQQLNDQLFALFAEARELIINQNVDPNSRAELVILIFEFERGLGNIESAKFWFEGCSLGKRELAALQELIINLNVDVNLRARLIILVLEKREFDLGDQGLATARKMIIDREHVDANLRARLANMMVEDLQLGKQASTEAQELIGNQNVDPNYRTELAIQMLAKNFDLDDQGLAKVREMIIDREHFDADLRARLVIQMLMRNFDLDDQELAKARELIIDQEHVPEGLRTRLALEMFLRNLDIGEQASAAVREMIIKWRTVMLKL